VTSESFYDQVGGHDTFRRLAQQFYAGVAGDPELRALYPMNDLGPAEMRFQTFLAQYWGGPSTYSQDRGHPRLRMRHAPFKVTITQRDRWLKHIMAAVDSLDLATENALILRDYFDRAAQSLVNSLED
jgi:hemoglobin